MKKKKKVILSVLTERNPEGAHPNRREGKGKETCPNEP